MHPFWPQSKAADLDSELSEEIFTSALDKNG